MNEFKEIPKPLLAWYEVSRRRLPWREEVSPYRTWVSEIMLQQTRVEAVKPFFERFMKELPTIQSLAEAPEDKLLKLWEGLGYYSRVRNLQKAAQVLVREHDGQMPANFQQILALPGIGSYTAGAIASIAFGLPKPAVDGNVLRVTARYLASEEDIGKQAVKREREKQLEAVIPEGRAADFTQALIELGALVCGPNGEPKCSQCPLREGCRARRLGIQAELPKKTAPKARRIEDKTVLVLLSDKKTVLRKRPAKGLLAGLYEFPNLEGFLPAEQVLLYLKEQGLSPIRIRQLPETSHIFSHIEWHMAGYLIRIEEPELNPKLTPDEGLLFADKTEMERDYSIPSAFGAYVKYIKETEL